MLDLKVLDLNVIIIDIETLLRRVIGEDILLEIDRNPGLWRIKADQGQLEQVLMNLAVNARDAMPRGGKLSIQVENAELGVETVQRSYPVRPGSYVCLTVTDSGIGMDDATRARAFEPFFTTKKPGKGTGLGLSTVYGVVKQCGGYIELESFPGHGTTFQIHLPRFDGEPAITETDSGRNTKIVRASSGTILIAEDEVSLRTLCRDNLQAAGYTVLEAKDGEEALQISRECQGSIDLLLTDVIMPGMGGKALVQEMMRERPNMKILYVSGYTGYSDDAYAEQWPMEAGSFILAKPFTRSDLCERVGEALESRSVPSN